MLLNFIRNIQIISFTACVYALASEVQPTNDNNLLRCRKCGAAVANTADLSEKSSPKAIDTETLHVAGKSIKMETLVNPFHYMFDVVTAEKANCTDIGRNNRADSWYPGYTWRVCTCAQCGLQIGWTFEKQISNDIEETNSNTTFHGIMVTSIKGLGIDNDTDSRIIKLATMSMDPYYATRPPKLPNYSVTPQDPFIFEKPSSVTPLTAEKKVLHAVSTTVAIITNKTESHHEEKMIPTFSANIVKLVASNKAPLVSDKTASLVTNITIPLTTNKTLSQ